MKMDVPAKVNALRELQSATGEELRPLVGRTLSSSLAKHEASGILSVLDRAFKGDL